VAAFTKEGRPQVWKEGNHRNRSRYDMHGNRIEWAAFGLKGKPVFTTYGYQRWVARYNEKGKILEKAHFGAGGEPAFRADDDSFRTLWRYDAHGRLSEVLELGPNGAPRNSKHGWARWQRTALLGQPDERSFWRADSRVRLLLWKREDARGRILELANLSPAGRPLNWKEGYHRWTAHYDSRGNRVDWAAFGPDGKPVLTTWGFHRVLSRHDARGKVLESVHFGVNGEPVFRDSDGTFRFLSRYDSRGNPTEGLSLGPNGRPANGKFGWARGIFAFDTSGKPKEMTLWRATPEGKLVLWQTLRLDGVNKRRTTSWFGSDGKPGLGADGYHRAVADLLDDSRVGEERYLDVAGKPVLNRRGYARQRFVYRDGELIDTVAFDLAGKAVPLVAVVETVLPGGTAEGLGLKKGDILLRHRDEKVRSVAWFLAARKADSKKTGTAEIEVQRGAKRFKVQVKPGLLGVALVDVAEAVALPGR
jgi:hypothetical protein